MQPLGGETDIVFGQCHLGRGQLRHERSCGNMINMLNEVKPN
jgi:hypothetical protein